MQITTIGLDIAKNVFQVHGIDAQEKVVVKKQLRRSQVIAFFAALPPCLVGMEACATAHYWARELRKLGHEVRLMPAKDVKAYVKRNKNDAADAEAICEAVRCSSCRLMHPRLNPKENLWDEIREKIFKNYALKSIDAVHRKLEEAILYIERNPQLVRSITNFPYIVRST